MSFLTIYCFLLFMCNRQNGLKPVLLQTKLMAFKMSFRKKVFVEWLFWDQSRESCFCSVFKWQISSSYVTEAVIMYVGMYECKY
jgi:hypothetical protein